MIRIPNVATQPQEILGKAHHKAQFFFP